MSVVKYDKIRLNAITERLIREDVVIQIWTVEKAPENWEIYQKGVFYV